LVRKLVRNLVPSFINPSSIFHKGNMLNL
jgi:hypothetical protein